MKQIIKKYSDEHIAEILSKGYIGAIARGRAEAGPRALGNRSILADARFLKSKERINGLIKNRRAFQPLAPICLEEDFDKYFILPNSKITLDYMLYAVRCRPSTKNVLPAIVHADETARVQLVTPSNYPFLFQLLTSYKKVTDIGVLINTSFNGKGEPIVNTPKDAILTYKNLDLDFLVLNNFFISSKLW